MSTPNLYEQMFKTILSLNFGRTFWLDEDGNFCSAPTYKNGDTDGSQADYVSEWTDLEGVNLDSLFKIHKRLVEQDTIENSHYYQGA